MSDKRAYIPVTAKPRIRMLAGQWDCYVLRDGRWPWSMPRIITTRGLTPYDAYSAMLRAREAK